MDTNLPSCPREYLFTLNNVHYYLNEDCPTGGLGVGLWTTHPVPLGCTAPGGTCNYTGSSGLLAPGGSAISEFERETLDSIAAHDCAFVDANTPVIDFGYKLGLLGQQLTAFKLRYAAGGPNDVSQYRRDVANALKPNNVSLNDLLTFYGNMRRVVHTYPVGAQIGYIAAIDSKYQKKLCLTDVLDDHIQTITPPNQVTLARVPSPLGGHVYLNLFDVVYEPNGANITIRIGQEAPAPADAAVAAAAAVGTLMDRQRNVHLLTVPGQNDPYLVTTVQSLHVGERLK